MTATPEQEILSLRALNLTPKQIARKLGIKVSEFSACKYAEDLGFQPHKDFSKSR